MRVEGGDVVAYLSFATGQPGTATLRAPLMPDASGAWVSMTRPNPYSQHPEEFYSSDFIVAL